MHKGWQSALRLPDARESLEGWLDVEPDQFPDLEESEEEHTPRASATEEGEGVPPSKAAPPAPSKSNVKNEAAKNRAKEEEESDAAPVEPVDPDSPSDSDVEMCGDDLFKESKFKDLKPTVTREKELDLEQALEKQMEVDFPEDRLPMCMPHATCHMHDRNSMACFLFVNIHNH